MIVHVGREIRSEENEDEPDRNRNLHQVRHHDGRGQPDDGNDRLLDGLERSDQRDRSLRSFLHPVHDAVAALGRGHALQLREGRRRSESVFVHVDLKITSPFGLEFKLGLSNIFCT